MDENIIFEIVLNNQEVSSINLKKWFSTLVYFSPKKMKVPNIGGGKVKEYASEVFFEALDKVTSKDIFTIMLDGDRNFFTFTKGPFFCSITFRLNGGIYIKDQNKILKNLDDLFKNHQSVVAYMCTSEDDFLQNNIDIDLYKSKGKSLENVRLKQHDVLKRRQIIDIEYNPGHSHLVRDVWFGSCWKMWFGEQYFQYIPKEVLLNFNSGYETIELEDGLVRITLYENMWEYEKAENREIQWKFRKQVGMDEVAHQLKNKHIKKENPNPAIQILTENLKHGGVRSVIYYFNDNKEVVPKSEATNIYSYEVDENGKVIWSEYKNL
ncbi:hypothetical protein [Chengkuizengella sediminis]|uniref:hypothetical protein n=1 Tax=Chengkuizengella sediminis TaxID=1885917 RepID=UPI00138951AE|nr:hypothetical protein [Chengkuizengella sediminis]NDI33803.1 hypothetical protein [Chengkuizengella sediminis]